MVERAQDKRMKVEVVRDGIRQLVDVTDETSAEFLARAGTDAQLWTDDFVGRFEVANAVNGERIDDSWGLMIGWFSNAIEAGRTAGYAYAKLEAAPEPPTKTPREVGADLGRALAWIRDLRLGLIQGVNAGAEEAEGPVAPEYLLSDDARMNVGRLVGEAIGLASTCWIGGTGDAVFDEETASRLAEEVIDRLGLDEDEPLQLRTAHPALVETLRELGDSYGPMGVALAAALLSDPDAVARRLER
jgi:hypothetical protein